MTAAISNAAVQPHWSVSKGVRLGVWARLALRQSHHARQPIRLGFGGSGQPRSLLSGAHAIAAASKTGTGRWTSL